ncbi:iron export ABC transporter permease subunit FetB [bacterium]|nr:iron export ABC transporter permease subunit FetB [bacterium]
MSSATFAAGAIDLSAVDLMISGGLVLVAGIVSIAMKLDLEKRLAIAAIRTVVQLLMIGYILKWVFQLENAPAVFGVAGIMIAAASRAAVQRPSRTFRGAAIYAFATLLLTGLLTMFTVTGAIVRVEPWFRPQYTIPLLGMILGNGLTGISLSLDYLLEALAERREEVEMELSLGATRWEAVRRPMAGAVRRGMIPIINTMMVVGIVSLPGMMTGQILAGADPLEAVKYQIVVMFMISASTSGSCILLAWLVYRHLFNERHQLRSELIQRKSEGA